jgi:TRAP-type C4-dicarboxylate transport system permease small subunit
MKRGLDMLIGILAALALLLACWSVVARYVSPGLILDWSDEAIVMLLIWAMFLSGYRTTLNRAHIAVDLLTHGRSGRWTRVLHIVAMIVLALFACLMAASGAWVVADAIRLNEHTESTARIATWIYYASLPTGMILIAVAAFIVLLKGDPAPEQPADPL